MRFGFDPTATAPLLDWPGTTVAVAIRPIERVTSTASDRKMRADAGVCERCRGPMGSVVVEPA